MPDSQLVNVPEERLLLILIRQTMQSDVQEPVTKRIPLFILVGADC